MPMPARQRTALEALHLQVVALQALTASIEHALQRLIADDSAAAPAPAAGEDDEPPAAVATAAEELRRRRYPTIAEQRETVFNKRPHAIDVPAVVPEVPSAAGDASPPRGDA